MTFPFNLYLLAFAGACLTVAATLPLWRRACLRSGLVDDPGPRKIHSTPIPLAGGLAVWTGLLAPVAIGAAALFFGWADLDVREPLRYGFERRAYQLGAVLGGGLGMLFLGWWDDKRELTAGPKFAGQLAVACLVAIAGIRITLFVDHIAFSYAVTLLWILAVTNAFNFMDNMNGLSGGVGMIAAWFFAVSAARQGQYLAALLAFAVCGALLGFLPFNFPRATVFLGDSGSHLAGYLLAILGILPHYYSTETPRAWAVVTPLFILAVPLIDLLWVVWIRWRAGRPVYIGDTNHLSHRLTRRGWSKTQAVLWLWLGAAAGGAAALLLQNF